LDGVECVFDRMGIVWDSQAVWSWLNISEGVKNETSKRKKKSKNEVVI
jgi:hypothetical protein